MFWGGLIGRRRSPCCWWKLKKRSASAGCWTSAAASIAAAYAVGRTGCWAVGDDYGRPVERGRSRCRSRRARRRRRRASWRASSASRFPPGTDPNDGALGPSHAAVRGGDGPRDVRDRLATAATTSTPRAGCSACTRARGPRAVHRRVLPRQGRPPVRRSDVRPADRLSGSSLFGVICDPRVLASAREVASESTRSRKRARSR